MKTGTHMWNREANYNLLSLTETPILYRSLSVGCEQTQSVPPPFKYSPLWYWKRLHVFTHSYSRLLCLPQCATWQMGWVDVVCSTVREGLGQITTVYFIGLTRRDWLVGISRTFGNTKFHLPFNRTLTTETMTL